MLMGPIRKKQFHDLDVSLMRSHREGIRTPLSSFSSREALNVPKG